jgi:hypothetical protein
VNGCDGGKATTLALTPTLSPKERESNVALLVRSFNFPAVAALESFALKCVRRPGMITLKEAETVSPSPGGEGRGEGERFRK